MLAFAAEGITSQYPPLRWILFLRRVLAVSLVLFCVLLWAHACQYAELADSPFAILFIGGLILSSIGIIGEYVGKSILNQNGRDIL